MRYLGGKARLGPHIVREIERHRPPGSLFLDVFCGALNVVRHADPPRAAMDLNPYLIRTLAAARDGWDPPPAVPQEAYDWIKANPDPTDPLTGFILIGCSRSGLWSGGLAKPYRNTPGGRLYDPVIQARDWLLERTHDCRDVPLACLSYADLPDNLHGLTVYCDPPYEGTEPYRAVAPFDSSAFWHKATRWAQSGALVFVSEGAKARPPPGWEPIRVWDVRGNLQQAASGVEKRRTEILFSYDRNLLR